MNSKPNALNKTDAGIGSKAICRVSTALEPPSPDPTPSQRNKFIAMKALILATIGTALLSAATAAEPAIELRLVVPSESKDAVAKTLDDSDLWLEPKASFDSHDIKSAAAMQSQNQWTVLVTFTAEASERFGSYSKDHIGSRIALLSRGKIISAPVLREAITGGTVQISGAFTEETARKLAEAIIAEKPKSVEK